jgi:hypothetical protein
MENRAILKVFNLGPEDAARVAEKVVLEEIYLVDSKTWRDPLVSCPKSLVLDHKCSTEILRPRDEDFIDPDDPDLILCNFRLAAFDDNSPKRLIMKIEATFFTSFARNAADHQHFFDNFDVDAEDVAKTLAAFGEYFYHFNPISTAWTYWREFVQSMSTRMGYPALTVPMLEIVQAKKPEEMKVKFPQKESTVRKKVIA